MIHDEKNWPFWLTFCMSLYIGTSSLSRAIYVSLHGYKNSSLIIRDQRNFQVLKCNQRRLFSSGWGFRYQVSRYFLYLLHHIHKINIMICYCISIYTYSENVAIYLAHLFWCRYVWSIIITFFYFLGK